MGFWDKIKSLFGGGAPSSSPRSPLEQRVEQIVLLSVARRDLFEAIDIAERATASNANRTVGEVTQACLAVHRLYEEGFLGPLGYTRTKLTGNWVYHPKDADPASYGPPTISKTQKSAAPVKSASPAATSPQGASPLGAPKPAPPAPAVKPAAAKPAPQDPLDASHILALSQSELRARALTIDPYKTAWIGRVDVIPPQSDQRTALIDRGLILRGLLTPEHIEEIHRVGDLWLLHREAARFVESRAKQSVEDAMAERARERAERKAQKKRDAAARKARREAEIAARRENDIIYLGPGVSAGLADRRANIEALVARGLPVLSTPLDVARALGLSISELRWLCFHSEATERPHYVYFEVPKRSGRGTRLLSSPQPKLKAAQAWVLSNVLEKLPTEEPAHGFIKGRSTVSCARPHVAKDVVVNLDLSNFFPSIGFARVLGVFRKLGYSPAVATLFALLCTESPRSVVEFEGRRYWVAAGPRALPQGACTSPALSNQVARKLDRRLGGMCHKHGFVYTRYADDLTFSASEGKRDALAMFLARVRHIVTEEGFAINPDKGRVQRSGGRMEVTGIVVNDKPSVPREEVRRLRAILHHAKTTGLEAQNREGIPHFEAHLRGRLAYLHMVDPARGRAMLAELDAIVSRA